MRNNLDLLLSEGIIDEVLGHLQSGKEADVYCVRYRGQAVAAKIYKDRQQRSFKHNAAYKEGRKVRNSRTQRAMDKGSRFGRDEAEDAWKASEASALHLLHGRGVRVPVPVLFYEGVLLMQLVTDADGDAAPRLIDAPIAREHAAALYRDVRSQIVGVLCCDLIHGDLSPYNILLGEAGPTLIDFPQTISAAHNTQSETFFRRDLDNVLRFFASMDPRLNAHRGDARAIWQAYARRELTPDFVPTAGRFEEERRPPMGPPQGQRGQQAPYGARPPHGQHAPHAPHAPHGQHGQHGPHTPQASPQAHPQRPVATVPQGSHDQGPPRNPLPARGPAPEQRRPPPREPWPAREPQQGRPAAPAGPPQGRSYPDRRPAGPPVDRAPQVPSDQPPPRGAGPRSRGPIEVYVKRTGVREEAPVEAAPARPPAPARPQGPARPEAPARPQGPEGEGHGPPRRRRRY